MFNLILATVLAFASPNPAVLGAFDVELSSRSFSLAERYADSFVNEVFKYNILLTVKYMGNSFTLNPGETFAFHDQILPEYKGRVVKTTNAHFNFTDGFKSDGYLYGDGVCHLASLLYWAAKDAGLTTIYFANHDFAKINQVPKEYGVSIKFMPGDSYGSARQNLYITNNLETPVTFKFITEGETFTVKVLVGGNL